MPFPVLFSCFEFKWNLKFYFNNVKFFLPHKEKISAAGDRTALRTFAADLCVRLTVYVKFQIVSQQNR